MSDLIKCLRGQRIDGRSTDEVMCESADEIERLRREIIRQRERLMCDADVTRKLLADAERRNEKLRYRLAEIIGYCGRPGRDGEPYDTIQALARGEITLRGGGKP